MGKSKVKKLLECQKKKFTKGEKKVSLKCQSWNYFADSTLKIFNEVVNEGKNAGLNENLYVKDSRKDKATENMPYFIMLFWGGHPVGTSTLQSNKKLVIEKGCTLIFSQSVFGDIVCLMYPFKSELHERKEPYYILSSPHHPDWYTKRRIYKFLKYFLSYSQVSSFIGNPNIIDKYRICKLVLKNKKKKLNISKSFANLIKSISSMVTLLV